MRLFWRIMSGIYGVGITGAEGRKRILMDGLGREVAEPLIRVREEGGRRIGIVKGREWMG